MLFIPEHSNNELKGRTTMRNQYEASEVIELGKAQDAILSQKEPDLTPIDNFGVENYSIADTLDDFDE